MKKVAIIGFGRFGKTLFRLIKDDFQIVLYDKNSEAFTNLPTNEQKLVTNELNKVFDNEVIFYAVPISKFEEIVKSHKKHINENHLIIDVLSVKVHPKKVLTKLLKSSKAQALLTHPMFGPDSSKNGFEGLPIVVDKFGSDDKSYVFWKKYFESKGLVTVKMSAERHDKLAANSQVLAHFIGRGLQAINHKSSVIDTKGAKLLTEIMEMTTNDSLQLFEDMNKFNPYTKNVIRSFIGKLTEIDSKLTK